MFYAKASDGARIAAQPNSVACCPICGDPVQPKCGPIVRWHWAHLGRVDCDPWAEPDTAWHRNWQKAVPEDQREVVLGDHRADIRAYDGTVIELQHSSISVTEICERERHYGRMAWIFDATEAVADSRLLVRRRSEYVSFRWKHPRKTVGACRRPVLLDLGDGQLLRVRRIHLTAPCGGWGLLADRSAFQRWMSEGTRLVMSA